MATNVVSRAGGRRTGAADVVRVGWLVCARAELTKTPGRVVGIGSRCGDEPSLMEQNCGKLDIMDTLIAFLASPAVLVVLGAAISRATARWMVIEQQSMAELVHRRKIYADYQRALWAFAGQIQMVLKVAREPDGGLVIEVAEVKQGQEACRNVLADLQAFAKPDTQAAARDASESLSRAYNSAARSDLEAAEKHFDAYKSEFKRFAAAVNEEVSGINTILYVHATPLWRAMFRRLRRKPLPFEPKPTLTPLQPRSQP